MKNLNQSIGQMAERICAVLDKNVHSIWLYGSVVLDDFRPGWSDIDLLVLASCRITEQQAQQLVGLRQAMLKAEPDNPYYRSFEGIIADINEYLSGSFSRLVYWGIPVKGSPSDVSRMSFHYTSLQDTANPFSAKRTGASFRNRLPQI